MNQKQKWRCPECSCRSRQMSKFFSMTRSVDCENCCNQERTIGSPIQLLLKADEKDKDLHSSTMHTISSTAFDQSSIDGRSEINRGGSVRSDPGLYSETRRNSLSQSQSCCIIRDHFLTCDQVDEYFSRNHSSTGSVINVNISDIVGDDNVFATTAALKRCKKKVLNPFNFLICLIGWRQFFRGSSSNIFKILNTLYLILIILFLITGYVYQTISCSGKLNVRTDTEIQPVMTFVPSFPNKTTTAESTTRRPTPTALFLRDSGSLNNHSRKEGDKNGHHPRKDKKSRYLNPNWMHSCNHVVTTYAIPSILNFIAFCYGIVYFRVQENEQLHSLMERVFLQAQATMGAQEKLIRNCRFFLIGSMVWLAMNMAMEAIFVAAFGTTAIVIPMECSAHYLKVANYTFTTCGMIGVMLQQCINAAIVLNYGTQCEMIVLYTRGICMRLHEKSQELRETMHEILGVRGFVSLINGALARITALVVFTFCELLILGTCLLVLNNINTVAVYSYRILFVLIWLVAVAFPITQAARLTKIGSNLRHISHEIRVFGYRSSSQLELDSFMLFVNNAKLRAKLFSVEITPAAVLGTTTLFGITILLLFQTGVIGLKSFF